MNIRVKKQVILKPVLSEKSLINYKNNRICSFLVDGKATKSEIEDEFNNLFDIKPVSVNTVVSRDEVKFRKSKKAYFNELNRKYVKKAYINIGENTLDIFENIG